MTLSEIETLKQKNKKTLAVKSMTRFCENIMPAIICSNTIYANILV